MALISKMVTIGVPQVFGYLDLETSYLSKFNALKLSMKFVDDEVRITCAASEDVFAIKVAGGTLQALKKNQLGSIAKKHLSNTLRLLLDWLPDTADDWGGIFPTIGELKTGSVAASAPTAAADKTAGMSKPPFPGPAGSKAPVSGVSTQNSVTLDYFPSDQMKSAPTVKLADATMIYQPVAGTDSTSRYFVVGITAQGLKIAARWQSDIISVRVEKKDMNADMKAALNQLDFKPSNSHCSVHLHVGTDQIMASRTLAALLAGINNMDPVLNGFVDIKKVRTA